MSGQQNSTDYSKQTLVLDKQNDIEGEKLDWRKQAWIDYKALGGIIYEAETESWRKMPVTELAKRLSVDKSSLYKWRDTIPRFWDLVAERRKELNSQEWLARIHEVWKIKALSFKSWPITEAWLRHFDPNYVEPKSKQEFEIGDNASELLLHARRENIIDGEVVSGKDHTPANEANAGPLPGKP